MGKNEKTPITLDGKEYFFEDMTDEQKMLINHIQDLERKIGEKKSFQEKEIWKVAFDILGGL